mgnify:CR=1 FL=1
MLSPEELERYARHIVLQEVGGPGQAALKRARGLVVGAGGPGSPGRRPMSRATRFTTRSRRTRGRF